jgi:SH3 domain-containing YSC84-like protein 1
MRRRIMRRLNILLISGLILAVGACQDRDGPEVGDEEIAPQGPVEMDEASDALELMNEAAEELREMKGDTDLRALLQQSHGIFLVPHYARAAVGVGARGGEGVLLAKQDDGKWTGPIFYDVGAVSVGAQFGAEGGGIAMLLMTDEALEQFAEDDTTFNADGGLTIVDYSARAEATAGTEDVIMWSNAEGAFAGVSLSIKDIDLDEEENNAFYGKPVTSDDLLAGKVNSPKSSALLNELSAR